MPKNEVLQAAMGHEFFSIEGSSNKDLSRMKTKVDQQMYDELRRRPEDWCEDKERLLSGSRKRRLDSESSDHQHHEKETAEKAVESFNKLFMKIEESVEKIRSGQNRGLKNFIKEAVHQLKQSVSIFDEMSPGKRHVKHAFQDIKDSLPQLEMEVEKVLSVEERALTACQETLSELMRDMVLKSREKREDRREDGEEDKEGETK